MKNKRVILTGASRGIGREAALSLAAKGANLTLVVRDAERGREVQREIPGSELVVCDLSSLKDVKRAAEEILANHAAIDVLVNNAGAINSERHTTKDGYELTFAANHLSYMLLANLLRPALEKAPRARIVNVASDAHRGGTIAFDDLMGERKYGGIRAYNQSKLANILFTVELARRLDGTKVTANSLHPGVIASNFGRDSGGIVAFAVRIGAPFLSTPADGAKTTIFLASDPSVETVSGQYFKNCKATKPSREARDPAVATRLWDVSEKLIDRALGA